MNFITDKQTLDDLNILGKFKNNALFRFFNTVETQGGERLLDTMFRHPLRDVEAINRRSKTFQYFQSISCDFPFSATQVEQVESYLGLAEGGGFMQMLLSGVRRRILKMIGLGNEYKMMKRGMEETWRVLNQLNQFATALPRQAGENPFIEEMNYIQTVFQHNRLSWLKQPVDEHISFVRLIRFDYLLRHTFINELKQLLALIYEMDVHIAVASVAESQGFAYAKMLPAEANIIQIEEVWHPGLKKAVSNSITITEDRNVVFLTGANMAGKSTFMKSFGTAIYLSHMGFPVAAKAMHISVRDGIYTSINVPDNLNMGYSHFYAEVLRVKKVAEEVASSKNLVVIFDELFKGTNVKDAFDATVAVTEAFSEVRNCAYIISTHIIEAAEPLGKLDNFQFVFLPTKMAGTTPIYTYKLETGVTEDRHGKMIIDNEQIVEIILDDQGTLHPF